MLVNAIYDHGKLVLPDNLKTKNEKISVVLDIPDEKIIDINVSPTVYEVKNLFLKEKLAKLDSIRHYKTPYLAEDISDKDLLLKGIQMKYGYED
jgi:CTP synthase (UTP-ammonia lyase)